MLLPRRPVMELFLILKLIFKIQKKGEKGMV
jgi:hypothetical protein